MASLGNSIFSKHNEIPTLKNDAVAQISGYLTGVHQLDIWITSSFGANTLCTILCGDIRINMQFPIDVNIHQGR